VPELTAGVYRAFTAGDLATARSLQQRLARVTGACRVGYPPAGWKAALQIAGVCGPDPVPPGTRLSADQHARLAEVLTAEGLAAGQPGPGTPAAGR
jgi:dihydrodipicolinate synthase/N-acetylneuraminate lyase